jgi:hypothetical protein
MTMRVGTDKKCPFTSEVSIRGRILTGRVVSTKMTRTIIIRRDYLHYVPKYSTRRYLYGRLTIKLTGVSQTVMRRGIKTSQHTYRLRSVSTSETLSLLVSQGQ